MSHRSHHNVTGKPDETAVPLSGPCRAHCLLPGLVIALFPVFGFSRVTHTTRHQRVPGRAMPAAIPALGAGYRRHRRLIVPALGVLGIAAHVENFRPTRALPCHHHRCARRADTVPATRMPRSP